MPPRRFLRSLVPGLALALGTALVPGPAQAGQEVEEIIVRYRPGVSKTIRDSVRERVDARRAGPVRGLARAEVLSLGEGASRSEVLAELSARPEVLYAEPNHRYRAFLTPNDPFFANTWGLHNTGQSGGTADADIDAPEVWEAETGSATVKVAVVDTGADLDHPDLAGNLVTGKDFIDDGTSPADGHGHGTHVAGTIGAVGNNGIGVAGVAWDVSLMPLRVLDDLGSGSASDVAAAFAYAGARGVKVVNASLGGSYSQAIADAVDESPNTLFVVAAGNDTRNNDASATYPCNLPSPNLICVAATNRNDGLASFSNYGATSVDLGAPGVSITSTWPNTYATADGTSMASPHVAGAASLLWATTPHASVSEVRAALLGSVDPLSSLSGVSVTGGRLNVAAALAQILDIPLPPVSVLSPDATVQRSTSFTLSWGDQEAQAEEPLLFDVRRQTASLGQDLGAKEIFLTGTADLSTPVTADPGSTSCFSARVSPDGSWGSERCTIVPADDTSLARSGGWMTKSDPAFYLGSASKTKRRGSKLTLSGIRAKDLSLVASRCGRCGTVKVRWNGETLKKIRLTSSSTRRTRIISVASFGAPKAGTLVIKVVSRGRPVLIEGMAVGAG